jgi:hypothetical protein
MFFILLIALVTILTLLLPVIVPRLANRYHYQLHPASIWLLVAAAILYFAGTFLPDIHISSETSTFQEHFLGGVYTALLYIYFAQLAGWRPRWYVALFTLFAWTSALGTFNELVEFTLVKLNITYIDITDTSWDLVANTCGSFAAYGLVKLGQYLTKLSRA